MKMWCNCCASKVNVKSEWDKCPICHSSDELEEYEDQDIISGENAIGMFDVYD